MCRNIKALFNFEPPANQAEIDQAAQQFVRKVAGFTKPSRANQAAFDRAVEAISADLNQLFGSLVTTAPKRNREIEAAKAKARRVQRFSEA